MLYDVLVALHVVSAVVGFGAVALSGVYGATARHGGRPDEGEEVARYFRSPGRAQWLILLVPFLGAAALGTRPEGADFAAVWVVTAAVVWLAAAVLLLFAVLPPSAASGRLGAAPGPRPRRVGG